MRFIWPLPRIISRDFYYLSSIYIGGQHMGTDIPAPAGTPIKVVADGEVRGIGWDMYSGFFVAVDHAGNWTSRYRHLCGQAPVTRGQQVSQGQVIGTVGSTGWSTGPHLHLDLWNVNSQSPEAIYKQGWWAHDPELYLGKEDPEPEPEPEPKPEPKPEEEVETMAMYVIKGAQGTEQSVFNPETGRKRKLSTWEEWKALKRTTLALGQDFVNEEIPQADYDKIPYDG